MVPAQVWKEDKVNLLEKLWQAGFSCSTVADKMRECGYDVTRNAVIGKVHRLGLQRFPGQPIVKKKRATPNGNGHKTVFLPKPDGIRVVKAHNGHKGADVKEPRGSKHLLLTQTKEGDCRAIIGYRNGQLGEAICCGETTPWVQNRLKLVRSPWCEYHRNLYVQKENRR